ncbi:MAG: EF-hand domain-containing protein [Arenimonas sp.]
MNKLHLMSFALLALSPAAFSQTANTSESTQIEASTGPVTVTSHQSSTLPNASDYAVQISDLDKNGDGRLSRREIPSSHALTFEFRLVDRNHDGYITASELANWK